MLALVCLLTFIHYVGAQMRAPILPLYIADHGASPTGVGIVNGAHMALAALGSIPLGRASDRWGRRPLLLSGLTVSAITSLLLPTVESELALAIVYGMAGLGVAAFTPSALSLVGDAAPGRIGHAYAWYSTCHYGAIALGPVLGGLAAGRWGYRGAFVASAAVVAVALAIGLGVPVHSHPSPAPSRPRFRDVSANAGVWAGWVAAVSGLLIQGTLFAFFPLFASDRGLTPADIGVVFLILGLGNTLARIPAGWLVDRSGHPEVYALAGTLFGSGATALLPYAGRWMILLALVGVCGAVSGVAFVALGVALAGAGPAPSRGIVMGGYSTALYLGLALGSVAFGPIITRHGYETGFIAAGVAAAIGVGVAAVLWAQGRGGTAANR